jgi:hypothetical protein
MYNDYQPRRRVLYHPAIPQVRKMQSEIEALQREVVVLRRQRDKAFANFKEYRDAVEARRAAENAVVEFYREVVTQERPHRVLH